jgi:putative aminopeptidase FrvX
VKDTLCGRTIGGGDNEFVRTNRLKISTKTGLVRYRGVNGAAPKHYAASIGIPYFNIEVARIDTSHKKLRWIDMKYNR